MLYSKETGATKKEDLIRLRVIMYRWLDGYAVLILRIRYPQKNLGPD